MVRYYYFMMAETAISRDTILFRVKVGKQARDIRALHVLQMLSAGSTRYWVQLRSQSSTEFVNKVARSIYGDVLHAVQLMPTKEMYAHQLLSLVKNSDPKFCQNFDKISAPPVITGGLTRAAFVSIHRNMPLFSRRK